ncbi:MAG TPA: HAMP domain-containing sensor histidine kinase [Candidatus Paceibacterota bacterium]|nr:HAMP domain-containing sensor histidine kinase [Candidatus Paceibacterota bacterium]
MDIFGVQTLVFGWLLLIVSGAVLASRAVAVYRKSKKIAEQTQRMNARLQELLQESHETGKMLVRRDLELTQSNERLRDLDEIKSQFVSVAAHQLRTPLTGIKWTLYALLEERMGKLNREQKKFAKDAYESNLRLIDLVNDLLDASRLEEGRFGFKKKRQAFAPVVEETCETFRKTAAEKGIAFSLQMPKGAVPQLDFDENRMRLVLENLLDNAIKYTPPGGSVTVKLWQEKSNVSVEVADMGIGMPEDQISKVFTKFFRAENAQLAQTSGTGLGLYLVKNIVEHHGGAVFFTTKENKGSAFTFTLPTPQSDTKKI